MFIVNIDIQYTIFVFVIHMPLPLLIQLYKTIHYRYWIYMYKKKRLTFFLLIFTVFYIFSLIEDIVQCVRKHHVQLSYLSSSLKYIDFTEWNLLSSP